MHQSHSLTPYDILHNIDFSTNLSLIFTYLNYFPPPPPVIPGPPPRHSWICSARSLSLQPCFAVDDPNHSSSHTYIPSIATNQSSSIKNISYTYENDHQNFKSLSIKDFFQHQLILIFFLSIFISFILVVLIFLCIQRNRQRQSTSNTHREVNNNNNHKYFYHRLIPDRTRNRRRKRMPTTTTTTTEALRNTNDGNNLLNLTNHDSPSLEAIHLSKINVKYTNANEEEQEEAV